ncbi:hypothetical protein HanHA89_Chr07g0274331 [Helianthus annuus]|nr:hypothetical protein HanHA89_Chr07g0274331 [Helianthus annuus]
MFFNNRRNLVGWRFLCVGLQNKMEGKWDCGKLVLTWFIDGKHFKIQVRHRFLTLQATQITNLIIVRRKYPDIAATMSDESIPTDPSPDPSFLSLSAAASALLLNI